ncbi:MAG: hypothetical protein IKZ44_10310 [Clostridia bacterium]|nr:hypothetical protein [Clostridia bacterium]
MKRIPSYMLLLLLCLSVGCKTPPAGQTSATEKPLPTAAPVSTVEPSPAASLRPSSAPVSFTPGWSDGEAYVSLANQNCDFYDGASITSGVSFKVISEKEIGKENIRVNVPIRTAYTVEVTDVTEEFRALNKDGVYGMFGFQTFLMLQNPDWEKLGDIRAEEAAISDWIAAHHAGETSWEITDPEEIAMNQKLDEGYAYLQPYRDAWEQFTEADIPEYHVYYVNIHFETPYTEEKVDRLTLTLGEKESDIPFGTWRLHPNAPEEMPKADSYGLRPSPGVMVVEGNWLDGGFGLVPDALSFTAGLDDVTVTGAYGYGTDCEIVGAHIKIPDANGEAVSDYYWDMHTPLDFKAGQSVEIDVILYHERLTQYEFEGSLFLTMEYEVNGRPHAMTVPCALHRSNDVLETYLAVFKGLDLSAADAYLHGEHPWVENLPDAWRR